MDDGTKIQLSSADNKKLEKADKESQKAVEKMKEADKLYSDISQKQADLTAEESDKLNNKALQKQIESMQFQKSANSIRFDVYSISVDEFWKNFKGNTEALSYAKSLEQNARSKYQNSMNEYKESEGIEDKLLSYSKMTSAADDLSKAVEGIKQAFEQISKGTAAENEITQPQKEVDTTQKITQTITEPTKPVDTVKTNVIDAQPVTIQPKSTVDSTKEKPTNKPKNIYQAVKVDETMIDKFNKFVEEKYPKDYEKIIIDFNSLDYSDIESLRTTWDAYLYGPEAGGQQMSQVSDTSKNKVQDSTLLASDLSNAANMNNQTIQQNKSKNKKDKANKNIKGRSQANENTSGNELNSNSINERRKGGKTNPYQKWLRSFPDTTGVKGFSFKVQVAACRVPLNKELLFAVYKGVEVPEEKFEFEWYKYLIGPFQTYDEALIFREGCGVKDAFIVGYLNGRTINAYEALVKPLDLSKSFINFNFPKDILFKVQVAASRQEMKTQELEKIYKNTEQVQNSLEDGWNKYLINCDNDYMKACEMLKTMNVQGAFIAVYKDGVRISFKEVFRK